MQFIKSIRSDESLKNINRIREKKRIRLVQMAALYSHKETAKRIPLLFILTLETLIIVKKNTFASAHFE